MVVQIVYWLCFALVLLAALGVVLLPRTVYNALSLVAAMVGIAGLFILMNAQLAAVLQVIVYAGAVMVLFLFVIMLLDPGAPGLVPSRAGWVRWCGFGLAAAFAAQVMALTLMAARRAGLGLDQAAGADFHRVALLLTTDYLYAFEMTSVLLLVAVVGAVALARRHLIQGADDATLRRAAGAAKENR